MDGIPDFSKFTEDKPLDYKENGFTWGFTTKDLGDGRKEETYTALLEKLKIKPKTIVKLNQVHGTDIKVVEDSTNELLTLKKTDGVITKVPGVLLSVLTADCVPVIYIDQKNNIIGASHQGWKGSLANMAKTMVEKMVEAGAEKESIIAYIGPSIGACCYNVEKNRYLQFKEEYYSYLHLFTKVENDTYFLNLAELNVQQLLEAGLGWGNVNNISKCTSCNAELSFSYRRDKEKDFGEMIAYVYIG